MKKIILFGICIILITMITTVVYADTCDSTNSLRLKHIETFKINGYEYHVYTLS